MKTSIQPVYDDQLTDLADRLGCPPTAVRIVVLLLEGMFNPYCRHPRRPDQHVSAREFCDALLATSGAWPGRFLRSAGLNRSEDVGRIVFALAAEGFLELGPGDSESDFAGLFDLTRSAGAVGFKGMVAASGRR